MNIVELIGFLISFLAFLYLMFHRIFDGWMKEGKKASADEGEEESLENFLKALQGDMEVLDRKKEPPPLPVKPKVDKRMIKKKKEPVAEISSISAFDQRVEKAPNVMSDYFEKLSKGDAYEVLGKRKRSYGRALLQSIHSKKELVIYSEILNRPKGFHF